MLKLKLTSRNGTSLISVYCETELIAQWKANKGETSAKLKLAKEIYNL